jgi:hypothetical protein
MTARPLRLVLGRLALLGCVAVTAACGGASTGDGGSADAGADGSYEGGPGSTDAAPRTDTGLDPGIRESGASDTHETGALADAGADGTVDGRAVEAGEDGAAETGSTAADSANGGTDATVDAVVGDATPDGAGDTGATLDTGVAESGIRDGAEETGLAEASAIDTGVVDAAVETSTSEGGGAEGGVQDAGGPDVVADAGQPSDGASSDGSTCGGTICFAGQSCVAGECVFPCTGVHVPGDYPTIQAAVDAPSSLGATICLAAQTYDESVTVGSAMATIQGVSPGQTFVTGGFSMLPQENVTVLGLTTAYLDIGVPGFSIATLTVRDCSITQGVYIGVGVASGSVQPYPALTVVLDGLDITDSSGLLRGVVEAYFNIPDVNNVNLPVNVTLQNSYLHGGTAAGVFLTDDGVNDGLVPSSLALLNNTMIGNSTGIRFQFLDSPELTIDYFNNIVVGSSVGIDTTGTDGLGTLQSGSNVLFGNATNYGDAALPGPGDIVTKDPLLDTSTTPPGLRPGSPARGAARSPEAPATDFWGRPRGAHPDIGAVQSD